MVFNMNESLIIFFVISSCILVIYHHLIYPLLLRFINRYKKDQVIPLSPRHYTENTADKNLPTITIVMPAYNEQHWISEKIRNLAILDYPMNRLNIIIACDGCTDNTAASAQYIASNPECQHLSIEVREFKVNRGKVAVLNDVLKDINDDLIALSDVSALISVDALLIAAMHFNDPEVGVLNGHYYLLNPSSIGEKTYWQYQNYIKKSEAQLGSTLGAHGAFYIFRRSLFTPLDPDTINDDFILPMKIVAKGYRAKYESRIKVLELEHIGDDMDHYRRRRIAAGNFQQVLRLKNLMLPKYGGIAFAFISGKGLRVLMPFLMIISLFGSIFLATYSALFILLASIQLFLYFLVTWQVLFKPKKSAKLMQALTYLVCGHMAGLIGALRYIIGLERGYWKRIN